MAKRRDDSELLTKILAAWDALDVKTRGELIVGPTADLAFMLAWESAMRAAERDRMRRTHSG